MSAPNQDAPATTLQWPKTATTDTSTEHNTSQTQFSTLNENSGNALKSATPATTPATTLPLFASTTSNEPAGKTGFAFNANAGKKDEPAKAPFKFASFAAKKDEPAKSGFSFGSTTEKKDEPAKSGFSFGSTTVKKDEPAKSGFSFGSTTEKKDEPAKSGFSFGSTTAKKDEPAKPAFGFGATTAKKDEPAKPAFGFGAAAEKKDEPAKPAFGFGAAAEKKDTVTPAKPAFAFGATAEKKVEEPSKPSESNTAAVTAIASTASTSKLSTQAPEVNLDNKTLDDLVSKWAKSLDTSYNHFDSYLSKINEWDNVLVDGGEKISKLYSAALMAEQTQNRIEQSLQYIERQQTDLELFLDNFEQKTEKLLADISPAAASASNTNNTNDEKRKQAHQTALQLDDNLNSLSANLTSLTEEINSVSENFNKGSQSNYNNKEEGVQIIKLLNSHLFALNALGSSSDSLEQQLKRFGK